VDGELAIKKLVLGIQHQKDQIKSVRRKTHLSSAVTLMDTQQAIVNITAFVSSEAFLQLLFND